MLTPNQYAFLETVAADPAARRALLADIGAWLARHDHRGFGIAESLVSRAIAAVLADHGIA